MSAAREANPRSIGAAVASGVGLLVGPNVTVSAVVGLFMVPLARSFSLDRTEISALMVILPWTVALFVGVAGRAIDRFGLRQVVLPSVVIYGAAQFCVSFVQNPWQLTLGFFLLSVAAAAQSAVAYVKLVSLWFNRSRAMVLGIMVAVGSGVGSAVLPQLLRLVMEDYGWRAGYRFIGLFIVVIGLPVMYFFLREPRGAHITLSMSDASAEGITLREAVRRRTFWMLWVAIFLTSMSLIGTIGHSVALLTERGFSLGIATTALSFIFIGSVTGQLSSGLIADRVSSPRVLVPYFFGALCGVLVLHIATAPPLLFFGAFLMGLGLGGEIALAGFLCSRYFGLRHLGSIYALVYAASNLGVGAGYILLGVVHDTFGNYTPTRVIFGVAMLCSTTLIFFLGPYRYAGPSRKAPPVVQGLSANVQKT